jgi:double-stranded uracil-DNA glycosylase
VDRGGGGVRASAASTGFAPIADSTARALILGTLPGRLSLARGEYYAQPRNAFWPIMGELFGAGPELDYRRRTVRLIACGVAVWDVCASARRSGSLDAAIERDSIVVNDFVGFFAAHPRIGAIYMNGAAAEALFARHVLPRLDARARGLERHRLPSTSPANASIPYALKRNAWRRALRAPGGA